MSKSYRLPVFISLVLLVFGLSCSQSDRVEDLFDEGDRLLKDSLPEAALEKFQRGLLIRRGTSEIYFDQLQDEEQGLAIRGLYGVINAYLQKGDYQKVETHLENAGTKPFDRMFVLKKLLGSLERDKHYTELLALGEKYFKVCGNIKDSTFLYARLSRIQALKARQDLEVKGRNQENVEKTAIDYALQAEKLAGDGVALFNLLWEKDEVGKLKDLLGVYDQLICYYETENDLYNFPAYLRQQNQLLKISQVQHLLSSNQKISNSISAEQDKLELRKYVLAISVLLLIIIILTSGFFIQWQINKRKAKEWELQSSLEFLRMKKEEQQRISETLHDDVGSDMTLGRSHLRKMVLAGQTKEAVDFIDDLFTTLGDKISSVIFQEKDDPKNSSLLKLIEKHCAEIETTCGKKVNIYAFGSDEYLLDTQRVKLNLIVKTALDNAIRHAKVNTVDLSYNGYEDYLNIMISDQGCGIAKEEVRRKLQARLNKRAKRIGGQVLIDSREHSGTTVTIDVQVLEPT